MDTMKIIYEVLRVLEKNMGEKYHLDNFNYEEYDVSENKWMRILQIMIEENFIDNISIKESEGCYHKVHPYPRITFKGLIYLTENSSTAKVIEAAKTLKDIIPGI